MLASMSKFKQRIVKCLWSGLFRKYFRLNNELRIKSRLKISKLELVAVKDMKGWDITKMMLAKVRISERLERIRR